MRRSIAALLVVTATLAPIGLTHAAYAQTTRDCEEQVGAIRSTLDADARRTQVWYWSWMAAGTALLGGQAALAALTDGDLRREEIVGASASMFIPAFLLLHPPGVLSDAPLMAHRLALTTVDGGLGDPCESLLRARDLLNRDAHDERFAKAWFAHAFVIGGNIALGLLLGIGFGDWVGFAKQAVGGSIVGELQIFTLPGIALQARGLGVGGSF